MAVTQMKAGDDENSYAKNAFLPRVVISAALPVVDEAVKAMFSPDGDGGSNFTTTTCFRIVDFGCSSGSNTLFAVSHILKTIQHLFQKGDTSHKLPEFEVFLSDLPDNDFNHLFKLLSSTDSTFKELLQSQGTMISRERCSWYGLPGSFYHRLFPDNSIHFAFSSYSVHWLSQVPEGVDNKENIYITKESGKRVFEAYAKQFQRDFATFLGSRSNEIVSGGHMVLIIRGRGAEDHSTSEQDVTEYILLAETLGEMVSQGRVNMEDLQSFNMPLYFPCEKEVEQVIGDEGSFYLNKLHVISFGWEYAYGGPQVVFSDMPRSIKVMATGVRAYMEPLLASHFGNSIIDQLFQRYAEKAAEHIATRRMSYLSFAISLCRK